MKHDGDKKNRRKYPFCDLMRIYYGKLKSKEVKYLFFHDDEFMCLNDYMMFQLIIFMLYYIL